MRTIKDRPIWGLYQQGRKLGSGMTGTVFLVKHKITGQEFALKSIEKRRINPALYQDMRNEISILQMVRCVVRCAVTSAWGVALCCSPGGVL